MKITELISRFEYYAINNTDIGHVPGELKSKAFLHIEAEELQQAVKQGIKFPALLLQTPEAEKTGVYDNISEEWSFTYVVLMPQLQLPKSQIIAQCKQIADEIFKRIMLDVDEGHIPGVVAGSSEGLVGPLTDQVYGWGVSIALSDGFDARVIPEKWLDLSGPSQPSSDNSFPYPLH